GDREAAPAHAEHGEVLGGGGEHRPEVDLRMADFLHRVDRRHLAGHVVPGDEAEEGASSERGGEQRGGELEPGGQKGGAALGGSALQEEEPAEDDLGENEEGD